MGMTGEQYDALVNLMRGNPDSPANRAARRVLVDGIKQADAKRETGVSRDTVSKAVRRYSEADQLIQWVYGLKKSKSNIDCMPLEAYNKDTSISSRGDSHKMESENNISKRYINALRQLPQYLCVVSDDVHLTHAMTGVLVHPVANAETLEIRYPGGHRVEVIAHLFFMFALQEAAEFEIQTSPADLGIPDRGRSPLQKRIADMREHLTRKHSLDA